MISWQLFLITPRDHKIVWGGIKIQYQSILKSVVSKCAFDSLESMGEIAD